MTPLERAAATSRILAALAGLSDGDLAIVDALHALGSPTQLATSGPAPAYDRATEAGSPAGVVVHDPRPDSTGRLAAEALGAYRAIAAARGLARLP